MRYGCSRELEMKQTHDVVTYNYMKDGFIEQLYKQRMIWDMV